MKTTDLYINPHGKKLYASTSIGHRIAGDSIMLADSTSTTLSRNPITEISVGILPDDADIEEARSILTEMVLEQSLTTAEFEALVNVYPAWEHGVRYSKDDLIAWNGKLYKVNQDHDSQAHLAPDTAGVTALYSKAVPGSVVPDWVQPEGAHNPYNKGDLVSFDGRIWLSIIDNNVWSPATYPAGWEDSGAV